MSYGYGILSWHVIQFANSLLLSHPYAGREIEIIEPTQQIMVPTIMPYSGKAQGAITE